MAEAVEEEWKLETKKDPDCAKAPKLKFNELSTHVFSAYREAALRNDDSFHEMNSRIGRVPRLYDLTCDAIPGEIL